MQEQDEDEAVNLPPDAHAGRDRTVGAESSVRLDAALRFDTDGSIAEGYKKAWAQYGLEF